MYTLFDYLLWRGDLSMTAHPFNEIDGVILSRFAYMPFEMTSGLDSSATIGSVCRRLSRLPDLERRVMLHEDVRFLPAMAESERFAPLPVFAYENTVDSVTQTQFCAMTIRLPNNVFCLSFRGTDNTLVGWKEDFNMSFVCPVPAQKSAVQYLEKVASMTDGRLIVLGHSKGGNLAVYAAAACSRNVQKRLISVYNFDGPGFDETLLATEGYRAICKKIATFVPQSSVIGLLLGHEESFTVVHSAQTGIMQHDTYSWTVMRDRFKYVDTVTQSSKYLDYTLKAWLAAMSPDARAAFVDTIFKILSETNAKTFRELGENWFVFARSALRSFNSLDDETRAMLSRAFTSFWRCAKDSFGKALLSEKG